MPCQTHTSIQHSHSNPSNIASKTKLIDNYSFNIVHYKFFRFLKCWVLFKFTQEVVSLKKYGKEVIQHIKIRNIMIGEEAIVI